ncbi:MAG: Flp pilus assembly complex ATPase component TadA [Lachnospiraceae bacterium]|nr:Flp pilus assembly complex ATPase component TadA [Lachnospiraceae bacterium]
MIDIKGLLSEAVRRGASDLHICCGASPQYRIHGKLTDSNLQKMTPSDCLGVLLDMTDEEQRIAFEKDGVIDVSVSFEGGRFRVNAYKQRGTITLVIRIVDTELPDPKELFIPGQVMGLCEKEKGLVVVSGPSGSGKSTVLAAFLDHINSTRKKNIITLEDPIEYLHDHKVSIVNQREIGIDADSYEDALDCALREDPDVIFVSRIDSCEVLLSVLRAVENGKLVFIASFFTGVSDVVAGFIDMFEPAKRSSVLTRLSSALEGIVCRQLIPTKDGYRRPAYEVLLADNNVRNTIRAGKISLLGSLLHNGHDRGMFTMDESVFGLYKSGIIDADTAVRYSVNTDVMKNIVSQS